jgi:hypothetical protein
MEEELAKKISNEIGTEKKKNIRLLCITFSCIFEVEEVWTSQGKEEI